ncbi:MAG: CRISPR-associated helicase Cas3', partial [Spirochaetota bacterium]|nr:CRISPR-associated helicase Cas3' [Spirochaetota bacterium]
MTKVYAKGEPDWTTLRAHTYQVYRMVLALEKYFPNLPDFLKHPDFFEELKLSAFCHDFGKASEGFQKQLMNNQPWGYRHEILSSALFERLSLDDKVKERVIRTIISHHKDFNYLKEIGGFSDSKIDILNSIYNFQQPLNSNDTGFQEKVKEINHSEIEKMVSWLNKFKKLHLLKNYYNYQRKENLEDPIQKYVLPYTNDSLNLIDILLRGLLIASDHFASAGFKTVPMLSHGHFNFLDHYNLRSHQKQAQEQSENTLLIAPTGSGKTEASLLWFAKNFKEGQVTHLFYILPYTASINAMYTRLSKQFGELFVGISHSKAFNSLISFYMTQDDSKKISQDEAKKLAQKVKTQSKKLLYPVLITTPWQLIQYFFSIKFFEVGLSFMMDSAFIIDEIHCYDAKSMGLFLGMIKFLNKHFNTKFFIMSATIPTILKNKISNCLNEPPTQISLDEELLKKQCRHKINLIDGNILGFIDEIKEKLNHGVKLILVANSVNSVIEIYKEFKDFKSKVLLHGKFIAKDRAEKENQIKSDNLPQLLVGTQAIEVSLNIDYDEMYTESAPLDALLQRFGRVNREGKKGIANIYVTKEINKASKFIYSENLII